ncbi:MAG: GNAT family N-acetyltransferase [Pseudobacteriovorax sp.]|nr:GNAT family N-acetyltransferase [Pseudobacteriovorax sp.]
MIYLKRSLEAELPLFVEMETDQEVKNYIHSYSLEQHRLVFDQENSHYLTIMCDREVIGFFLLVMSLDDCQSVEFRRIVIRPRGQGFGQKAIAEMEIFCAAELKVRRIWLDVYEHNERGRHLYHKLGYSEFKTSIRAEEGDLLFFEKMIASY